MPAEGAASPSASAGRRGRWLLALGAAAGLALAAAQLAASGLARRSALPAGAVALVNDEPIAREEFERAVAALAGERRSALTEAEQRRVLERLIEEELLVQRGLELGLARQDRRVRGELVGTLIGSIVAESDGWEPSAAEVAAFHRENQAWFARPGRLRVRQILVRVDGVRAEQEARTRVGEALRRLAAGQPYDDVARELGDPPLPELPDVLLPPTKLREYLGPTAARAALGLDTGGLSAPLRSAEGFRILQLVEREPERTPPLAEVRAEVQAEMRRRAGDEALRAYLEDLRRRARVRVAESLP